MNSSHETNPVDPLEDFSEETKATIRANIKEYEGKSIFDFWPFPYPPRPNQVKAMKWLEEEYRKGTRYLILEAPVGTGKSNLGITFSNFVSGHNGNAFVLTPQRILQEQYETSFRGNDKVSLASFYGKSNYECKSKKSSCEVGSLVKPSCSSCPFKAAKKAAQEAGNTVMNYKLALLSFAFTQTFKSQRRVMVLDECHTLENHLVDFDMVQVTEFRAKKYDIKWQVMTTIPTALSWIRDTYLPKIEQAVAKGEQEVAPLLDKSGTDLTQADIKKIREHNGLLDHYDEVREILYTDIEEIQNNYVLVHDKTTMSFKRLKGAHTFHQLLDPRAEFFLFMSSTILNKDGFCQDLGIDQSKAAFLSLDSDFPVENRPVLYLPQMKMNADWKSPERQKERDRMLDTVKQILDMHEGESGIIHTGNFQIAAWLVDELSYNSKHNIYHHNPGSGDDRNTIINTFISDPNASVLISPSITEGLDLKDDLGRFAIFAKIPFGYLGDQWIKRRMEMSTEWYQRRALIDIIQGGGRVVRGPEDKGNVYILDASWAYLYRSTQYMVPKWWKAAYTTS